MHVRPKISQAHEWLAAGVFDFDPRGGSLKSQMKRADNSGARFSLVLGGAELTARRVRLKNMKSGEQQELAPHVVGSGLRMKRWMKKDTASSANARPTIDPTR